MKEFQNSEEFRAIDQTEIDNWDYKESVKAIKGKVAKHRKLSLEIVRELFIAQSFFAQNPKNNLIAGYHQGESSDVPNGTSEIYTFRLYLKEIGLSKTTAYNWLSRYIPGEDRLLEVEELKAIERKEKMIHDQEIMEKVDSYAQTAEYPAGWDEECQEVYDRLHRGNLLLNPVEQLEAQRNTFAHIFDSKIKRKSKYWNRQELAALKQFEVEPVRSLAQQIEDEREVRSTVAEDLRTLESIVSKYPDKKLAEVRIAIQNLHLKLREFE